MAPDEIPKPSALPLDAAQPGGVRTQHCGTARRHTRRSNIVLWCECGSLTYPLHRGGNRGVDRPLPERCAQPALDAQVALLAQHDQLLADEVPAVLPSQLPRKEQQRIALSGDGGQRRRVHASVVTQECVGARLLGGFPGQGVEWMPSRTS